MIVQTESQLTALCEELRSVPLIFLDTEFVGENRYYAELGSIQVAGGEHVALIDPLAIHDLSRFSRC